MAITDARTTPGPAPAMPPATYRPDIDGLRAVAVLAVVCYHAFPGVLQGGFVGVDVFFVISGFLISSILLRELERGSFSLPSFYARRIRRIFPALILLLAGCLLIGWHELIGTEFKELGRDTAAGAGFVSNIVLWKESGYFEGESASKPLLHLWSLGVEEQFYILWPVLLWALWRKRSTVIGGIGLLLLLSFVANVRTVRQDTIAAFYSPVTRFWELLAGAALAAFQARGGRFDRVLPGGGARRSGVGNPVPVMRHVSSFAGMLLLVGALVLLDGEARFPGWWAVMPVLASVALIAAGPHAIVNRILGLKPLVWIGLISYPLYLWHWPLLSFLRITHNGDPPLELRVGAVALALGLAWLTYRIVERPIRFGPHTRRQLAALVVLAAAVGGVGAVASETSWLAGRSDEKAAFLDYFENELPRAQYFRKINLPSAWRFECSYLDVEGMLAGAFAVEVKSSPPRASIDTACYERDPRYPRAVLVWGDSHAQHLGAGLRRHLPPEWQYMQVATSGCAPVLDVATPSRTSQCDQSNYRAGQAVRTARPDVVVLARKGGFSPADASSMVATLRSQGVGRVVVLGPAPRWNMALPELIVRRLWTSPRRTWQGIDQGELAADREQRDAFKTDAGQKYGDLFDVFCDADGCLTYLGDDRTSGLVSWDTAHLTPIASEYLAEHLLRGLIVDPD